MLSGVYFPIQKICIAAQEFDLDGGLGPILRRLDTRYVKMVYGIAVDVSVAQYEKVGVHEVVIRAGIKEETAELLFLIVVLYGKFAPEHERIEILRALKQLGSGRIFRDRFPVNASCYQYYGQKDQPFFHSLFSPQEIGCFYSTTV